MSEGLCGNRRIIPSSARDPRRLKRRFLTLRVRNDREVIYGEAMNKREIEAMKEEVLRRLRMTEQLDDENVLRTIDCVIMEISEREHLPLKEKLQVRKELFHAIRGLDVLSDLLEDPEVTEIMINGTNRIYVERDGKITRTELRCENDERLLSVIGRMISGANRVVNETNPIVDAVLPDGSRVNVVLSGISRDGSAVTIRKFPEHARSMEELVRLESLDRETADFLQLLVSARYNIFISGSTGCGKTTFLNALAEAIPGDERVITIEDVAELSLRGPENRVRLEARMANVEGRNQISIRDLVRTSLRMRPDRIIIGEVRDAAASDMISAMLTGHDGSLSTGHSNSVPDMLLRLEMMIASAGEQLPLDSIRRRIASALDVVVHLGRLRDKSRRVLEITEVLDYADGEIRLNPLYRFTETGEEKGRVLGHLARVGELKDTEKLLRAGVSPEGERSPRRG